MCTPEYTSTIVAESPHGVLHQGDCLEIMPTLPAQSVDMVLTSPPYDNLRTYGHKNILPWDFEGVAQELWRVIKPGGVVVWVVGDATINGSETGTSFRQALFFKEIGFNLHDTMIYQKDNCPFPSSNRYYANFEYMFILSKGSPGTFNPIADRANKTFGRKISGTNRTRDGRTVPIKNKGQQIKNTGVRFNCWLISEGARQKGHPAPFPLALARDHILSWSNPGDIILDPFAGSGTTGAACINTGRKFLLIEREQKYVDIIEKRVFSPAATLFSSELDKTTV